jgi:methylated-DNA-[protein]-cysteine S-methyltransferase
MDSVNIQYFATGYGELILGSFGDRLCLCDWRYRKNREQVDRRIQSLLHAEYLEAPNETVSLAIQQLQEYFRAERKSFDVPLLPVGSEFQLKVWEELMKIPYGNTETYLGLANRMRQPLAIRAIASANGANGLSLFVPCHRIIGTNGEMTGYAGGISTKRRLLRLEGSLHQQQLPLFGPENQEI